MQDVGSKRLFMGAGEKSGAQCYELVLMLHRALELLSAQQQSGEFHAEPDYVYHDEELDDYESEIEDIAKRIYTALTGKKIRAACKGHPNQELCDNVEYDFSEEIPF